jgi:hypothetical protein
MHTTLFLKQYLLDRKDYQAWWLMSNDLETFAGHQNYKALNK